MSELLVLTEHISHLTATYADVTSGNVHVGTDVTIEFIHECLAETHHFSVALTAGREVRTTLSTAHGECGERVLEGLLECEELQDTEVYALVETDTALVRTDDVVVLYTVTHVGLYVALVIYPRNTEADNAIGNAQTLDEVPLVEFGVLVVLLFDCTQNLTNGLNVLRLVWKSLLEILYNLCCTLLISCLFKKIKFIVL